MLVTPDTVKRLLDVFDEAMATEGVEPSTRRRVINILAWGQPDGDKVHHVCDENCMPGYAQNEGGLT